MNVLVQEVFDKWVTDALMLMNVLNNKDFVQGLEIAKIPMAVSNVFVHEVTNLTNLERSALIEMNARKILENVKPLNVEI